MSKGVDENWEKVLETVLDEWPVIDLDVLSTAYNPAVAQVVYANALVAEMLRVFRAAQGDSETRQKLATLEDSYLRLSRIFSKRLERREFSLDVGRNRLYITELITAYRELRYNTASLIYGICPKRLSYAPGFAGAL